MLETFTRAESWIALLTLTLMEVVLGIDNIIFLSILVAKLPPENRGRARRIGLGLALVLRLGLLATLSWIMGLSRALFHLFGRGFSGRDLILILGGLFLVGKATHEIYEKLEVEPEEPAAVDPVAAKGRAFAMIIGQIIVLDIIFSLDSVITAVGMARELVIMVIAMVVAVGVMAAFARRIGEFVNAHPSMKVLALSFLLLIGVLLVADGLGQHVSKGYVYFALGFSLLVELINMRVRKGQERPVQLHGPLSQAEQVARQSG